MDISEIIKRSIAVKQLMLDDQQLLQTIEQTAKKAVEVLRQGGRILLCGNGGSAADAQHIAAELTGRFKKERKPLDAEALHANTSYLTAVANDYSFEEVYARLIKAKARNNDMLIAISTSGNSPNILKAIEAARECKMWIVGLTGKTGGKMSGLCDLMIKIPSEDTPAIQEAHIMVGHILCALIEKDF